MGTFFAYSIQSSVCLALFYLFYKVLLSRDTFHRFNRIGLLGILVLSLAVPCVLALFQLHPSTTTLIDMDYPTRDFLMSNSLPDVVKKETGNVFLSFLLTVYLAGCLLCLLYVIMSTLRIGYLIKKGACSTNGNGTKLILLDDITVAAFSWMKYIVLSKSDYDTVGDAIITHENAHIKLRHSYDLMIAQLCIITQWFNPAAWLLYGELQHIHEYEADDAVLRKGIDAKQYQLLLIKKAVGTRLYSMANSLNHSNLKKRITMMYQKKSNPWARLKYAYVLPLAAFAVALFARPEISHTFDEISNAKVSHFTLEKNKNDEKDLPKTGKWVVIPKAESLSEYPDAQAALNEWIAENMQDPANDSIYITVEKPPQFPGGEGALMKWIADHMKYPEIAQENKIQGLVFCQFVVEKDGSVSNVEVARSVSSELDKEAVRVLKTLPKFVSGTQRGQPVRVRYHVPIRFSLGKSGNSESNKSQSNVSSTASGENETAQQDFPDDYIFITVEKSPEFPGGEAALLKWISDHIQYPEFAKENGIQGRVFCQFVVEKDGSVSNVEVARPFNQYLDEEAIRVLTSLPKFKPGTQREQPVRVRYYTPIHFSLGQTTDSL